MTPSDVEGLTGAVSGLTGEIQGLRAETQKLDVYGRRSRALIWGQWVLGLIVLLLVVAVALVAIGARRTAKVAQHNANRAVTQCEVLNNEGQRQRKLWEKVIVNQPPAKTPQDAAAQAAQVAQFRKDMDEAFVQQDCSKLK